MKSGMSVPRPISAIRLSEEREREEEKWPKMFVKGKAREEELRLRAPKLGSQHSVVEFRRGEIVDVGLGSAPSHSQQVLLIGSEQRPRRRQKYGVSCLGLTAARG